MFYNMKQMVIMARVNVGSLHRRLTISLSMAFSVALAVCVLVGFLSMAAGFEATLRNSGSASVVVVLGGGTNQETGSEIPADMIRTLQATKADIGVLRDAAGNPVFSREAVFAVTFVNPADGLQRNLALRGMDETGLGLRDGIALSAGRLFSPGTREIVVGDRLAQDLPSFGIDNLVRIGGQDWRVVGYFSANGGVFESEIWTGLDSAGAAFDRQGQVQTLRLRLSDVAGLERLQAALPGLSSSPLVAVTEVDLYAGQSSRTADLIRLFGWPIALLMAFGATAGALNTMMSSVSDRRVEIATVRALGFGRFAAFGATWLEAVVIAAFGTAIGLGVSWLVFNGWQASTMGNNDARMAFQLAVTGSVMLKAAVLGLTIGIAGGLLPALAASRIPLIAALRANGCATAGKSGQSKGHRKADRLRTD